MINIPEFEWFVVYREENFGPAILAGFLDQDDALNFIEDQPRPSRHRYETCSKDELTRLE